MQKQAPSFGRILTMVLFALSCFGLLLFLWISFGGPIPLKPEGYRFKIAFPEATQLGLEADVRVAGVRVGKVRGKELDPDGNRTVATIEMDPGSRRSREDREGDPAPEDAAGGDLRRADSGRPRQPDDPRRRHPEQRPGRADGRARRDLHGLRPQTRAAFRAWQQDLDESYTGRGQDLSDSFGNLPTFATDATALLKILDEEAAPLQRLIRDTGRVFAALTAGRGRVARADRQLGGGVLGHGVAERRARRDVPDLPDLPRRVARLTLARLRTFAVDTRPLIRDLRPVARDLRADAARRAPARARPASAVPRPRPADRRLQEGPAGASATRCAARAAAGGDGAVPGQPQPDPRVSRAYSQQIADFLGFAAGGLAAQGARPRPGRHRPLPAPDGPFGAETLGFAARASTDNRGNTYLGPTLLACLARPR